MVFTLLVDTVPAALNENGGKRRESLWLQVGRVVFPRRGTCGRHCGIGNVTKSSGTHDLGPHGRGQRSRPRDGPCKNKLELNAQVTGPMAASGGRKSGMDRKDMKGSSAPSVQHRMKQAQETYRTWHKALCCL